MNNHINYVDNFDRNTFPKELSVVDINEFIRLTDSTIEFLYGVLKNINEEESPIQDIAIYVLLALRSLTYCLDHIKKEDIYPF